MSYIEQAFLMMFNYCKDVMFMMISIILSLFIMRDNENAQDLSKESDNNKALIILGPSAVGKDTMINCLKIKYPKLIYKLPSYTTRGRRVGEVEGIDYYFVTKEEFLKMKEEGILFGIQEYNNNFYASNINKLREALEDNTKLVVLNYNIETVESIKDKSEFNIVAILPPSEAALRARLIQRNTNPSEIEKRMDKSKKEIQLIAEANYITYRLVNEDKDKAYNKLEQHLKELYPRLFL